MARKCGPKLWVRSSSFSHAKDSIGKLIQKHTFTRQVQLLLPVSDGVSISVPDISAFYYSVHAKCAAFTDDTFIEKNIANAAFHCMSCGHQYELAVTPDEHLHLVLSRSLWQLTGLQASQIADTGTAVRLLQHTGRTDVKAQALLLL